MEKMKTKTVTIGVKSLKEALKDSQAHMEGISSGKSLPSVCGVYFESFTAMRKALTEKRLDILRTVKREKPDSVYALAKVLGRDIKSVQIDLKFLEDAGLVEMNKTMDGRRRTRPKVNYDVIDLKIAV